MNCYEMLLVIISYLLLLTFKVQLFKQHKGGYQNHAFSSATHKLRTGQICTEIAISITFYYINFWYVKG